MQQFALIFLAFVVSRTAFQIWLSRRQIAHVRVHRDAVPQAFAESVTREQHAVAADYTAARQRLSMIETIVEAIVVVGLTLGGGIAAVSVFVSASGLGPVLTQTMLVLGVLALLALVDLPFGLYRTFSIEQRFGFNRSTLALHLADLAKGLLLAAVLGGAIVALVLTLMIRLGDRWWVFAWVAWTAFTLLLTWAWPRLIAPLFNRFAPLEDTSLRSRIDALLARCGFRSSGLFVMDGSRRSAHGNAYFTGLGRNKRIVFFDTLLSSLTPDEVESVLAHELGHFRLRHVPQRLLVSLVGSFLGFALLGWLYAEPWFYVALGVPVPSAGAALVLFLLVVPAFTWPLSPIGAAWSRRHEFQADDYAARHADAGALASALVKLYRENASTLTPDPLHSAWYDSHPPPSVRIARLAAAHAGLARVAP